MARRRGTRRPLRGGARKPKSRSYKVVCSVCGVELMVPVAPPPGKPLTCVNCWDASGKEVQNNAEAQ